MRLREPFGRTARRWISGALAAGGLFCLPSLAASSPARQAFEACMSANAPLPLMRDLIGQGWTEISGIEKPRMSGGIADLRARQVLQHGILAVMGDETILDRPDAAPDSRWRMAQSSASSVANRIIATPYASGAVLNAEGAVLYVSGPNDRVRGLAPGAEVHCLFGGAFDAELHAFLNGMRWLHDEAEFTRDWQWLETFEISLRVREPDQSAGLFMRIGIYGAGADDEIEAALAAEMGFLVSRFSLN